MKKDGVLYSDHHLLPKSMGGANNEQNILTLKHTTHQAIHTLFSNKMFAEQLIRMVDINAKALQPQIVAELLKILDDRDIKDPYDWYRRECIK